MNRGYREASRRSLPMRTDHELRRAGGSTLAWLVPLVLVAGGRPLPAVVCEVPTTHASLPAAVADLACTETDLSPQVHVADSVVIGRDLTVRGASSADTTLQGQLHVVGTATEVALRQVTIDATAPGLTLCTPEGLLVEAGAQVTSLDVQVLSSSSALLGFCGLFADGFESGDATAWSSRVP